MPTGQFSPVVSPSSSINLKSPKVGPKKIKLNRGHKARVETEKDDSTDANVIALAEWLGLL